MKKRAKEKMIKTMLDNTYFDRRNFYQDKIKERIKDLKLECKKVEVKKEIDRITVKVSCNNLPHLSIMIAVIVGILGAGAIAIIGDDKIYLFFVILFMLGGFLYAILKDYFEAQ